jgi:hypothetical protein
MAPGQGNTGYLPAPGIDRTRAPRIDRTQDRQRSGANIPALKSNPQGSRRVTAPRPSLTDPKHPNSAPAAGPFGLPMLEPAESKDSGRRTNPVPTVIAKLPETPAAVDDARVRLPEGTEPAQPSPLAAVFGMSSLVQDGRLAGLPKVPTYELSTRDKARAFYDTYARDFHVRSIQSS